MSLFLLEQGGIIKTEIPHMGQEKADHAACANPYDFSSASSSRNGGVN